MENHTSKHFVLQLGSLASLYLSLTFLLILVFGIINSSFADATDSYWQITNYSESIRIGIAFLVVFFPTYLILTRVVNTNRRSNADNNYLGLTKWLIYLSLLVGGGVLLGDLVVVIMSFLEGEITIRFILKALSVLVVVGSALLYYIYDARGYWLTHEAQSKVFGLVAGIAVLCAIVLGFIVTESPSEARERGLDQTQITDLEMMQSMIENFLVREERLPSNLAVVYGDREIPQAPENRPAYVYGVFEDGFQLCATFATANDPEEYAYARPFIPTDTSTPIIVNPYDWSHEAGFYCFTRNVKNLDESTGSIDTE